MKLTIQQYFPDIDDKLAMYRSDPEDNDKEHCHEFNELVIVTGGRGFHIINGVPYFIKRGDVFYVNLNDCHFYDEINDLRLINILINPDVPFCYLSDLSALLTPLTSHDSHHLSWLSDASLNTVIELIDDMFQPHQSPSSAPHLSLIRESIFYRLVTYVLSNRDHGCSDRQYRIHCLLKDMEHHYNQPMNWETIAARYQLSQRSLFRHIKSVTGMTPEGFMRRLRLIYARKQLQQTDESITDIALQCGFSSSSHFATSYHAIFGLTPTDERRRLTQIRH